MNQVQQTALLKAARASLVELQANPVTAMWQSTLEFQAALDFASGPILGTEIPIQSKIVKRAKNGKIPKIQYGVKVWRDGRCLDAVDAYLFAATVARGFSDCYTGQAQIRAREGLFDLPDYLDPHRAEREATLEQLATCGCSHKAERHEMDEQDNLLQCKDCGCPQFHYAEVNTAQAA